MIFNDKEIERLILSIIVLSFAFMQSFYGKAEVFLFIISFVLTSLSYTFKQIIHYLAGKKFGFNVEYKLWGPGTVLAAVSSLFPLTFAVLGYIEIKSKYHDHVDRHSTDVGPFTWEIPLGIRKALISYAGIMSNLLLGMILLSFPLFDIYSLPLNIFKLGAFMNFSLALFNLLPVPDLDGIRVITYRASVWVLTTLMSLLLLIMVFII